MGEEAATQLDSRGSRDAIGLDRKWRWLIWRGNVVELATVNVGDGVYDIHNLLNGDIFDKNSSLRSLPLRPPPKYIFRGTNPLPAANFTSRTERRDNIGAQTNSIKVGPRIEEASGF
ncbi:hypothetical protein DEO72_LG4g1060 [Vigna unguiculata]|uniref:Uncharacterized protein n=1 Tax=Vigna unguiculata TaxID=3917 RepID=A0A4D6LPM0_VIGUN|nr:hypothetical protein DEO72_LG4g1060 [Vigna unguiculata]